MNSTSFSVASQNNASNNEDDSLPNITLLSIEQKDSNEPLFCWICREQIHSISDAEFLTHWVAPCKCEGLRKYCHQKCLLAFIVSNKYTNSMWEPRCNWCGLFYLISTDRPSFLYKFQNYCNSTLNFISPWFIDALIVVSFGTAAYCYTNFFLKFIGAENEYKPIVNDSFDILKSFEMISFPFMLIYYESFNWEYAIAGKIIKYVLETKLNSDPNFRMINEIMRDSILVGSYGNTDISQMATQSNIIVTDTISTTATIGSTTNTSDNVTSTTLTNSEINLTDLNVYPRHKKNIIGCIFTGLFMPFVSNGFGHLFLPGISHNMYRTFLSYLCIKVIRGTLRLAHYIYAINYITSIKIVNRNQLSLRNANQANYSRVRYIRNFFASFFM